MLIKINSSARLPLIFSLTALIFYFPANWFPFMSLEIYGNKTSSTIWSGIVSLVESGSWPIALVIFLASVIVPFVKLSILFYLSFTAESTKHVEFKKKLYRIVEIIGRWSMLDIFLLAVLVSIMKLGKWTTAKAETGSWLFALVVIFTMLASEFFNSEIIGKNDKHDS